MVLPMDQEAIEGAMDQEGVEGAMDQEAVEGAMDGTNDGSGCSRRSDGSGSSRWCDGWYQRWIRKQSKERWVVPTMDYEAVEGAMDGTVDGSGSS